MEYLVIAGDDRVVPFFRFPDTTEEAQKYSYCSQVSGDTATGAAICNKMILTDDYYGDRVPSALALFAGQPAYVPDLGIGRLVENAEEIVGQIDTFLADSSVTVADAVVTSFSEYSGTGSAICKLLTGDGLSTDCSLSDNLWRATDLVAKVLNVRHGLAFISGHAQHYRLGCPGVTWLTADMVAAASVDHARTLFYTVWGGHSGLNVPPESPHPLDLPQAFAQLQATYLGNTGFFLGCKTAPCLSAQLAIDFVEQLTYGRSATAGQALAAAKQEYYLACRTYGSQEQKAVNRLTLYGLPMYRYTTAVAPPPSPPTHPSTHEPQVLKEQRVRQLSDGLTVNSISYQFPPLGEETTDDGVFYHFGGRVHTGDGEPVQPKYIADLSFPQTEAHGLVFKSGTYTDVLSFDPVVDQVITMTTNVAEPLFEAPGWYPSLLTLNHLERGDRLVAILGQFQASGETERIYDRLGFDVYYHVHSDDWSGPAIHTVTSGLGGGRAWVTVRAEDPSGVHAVVVAYTHGDGVWSSTEMGQNYDTWSGEFAATVDTRFFVQAVDGAGNVSAADNDGRYYAPGEGTEPAPNRILIPLVVRG
jgi:hypothetical protein